MPLTFIPEDKMPSSKSTGINFIPEDEMLKDDSRESPGILESIGNALAPGLGSMTKILAQNPKSLPSAAEDLVKSVPRAAADTVGNLASLALPFPYSDMVNDAAQKVPTPSPEGTNALELAAGVIPAARAAESIPDIAKLATLGGKSGLRFIQNKLGNSVAENANSFMDNLLGNTSLEKSHIPVLNEIRKNYNEAKTVSGMNYKNILQNAEDKGYSPTVAKQFAGIDVMSPQKSISSNGLQNELEDIDLSQHSKKIQNRLKSFFNNPSFESAHDLQSKLGVEGAKLNTNADPIKRSLGGELLGARDALKKDIFKSLLGNGDKDLANQYSQASDFFKNNVAPFRENTTIRKVVMGKGLKEFNPSNIINVLKKDDGSIPPIQNALSDKSKNLLLASHLRSATQELPTDAVNFEQNIDPQKLINSYGDLRNKQLSFLRTPQANKGISDLIKDLNRKETADKISRALKWSAGLGLGAAGLNELRKLL